MVLVVPKLGRHFMVRKRALAERLSLLTVGRHQCLQPGWWFVGVDCDSHVP